MKIILDSSAWYAFVFPEDRFHSQAIEVVKQNPFTIVPYPVLEEVAALIHHRTNKQNVLESIYKPLVTARNSEIIYISATDDQQIWQTYQELPNKIDYVDASVIWLSRKLDLPIFTFDRHLRHLDLSFMPNLSPQSS